MGTSGGVSSLLSDAPRASDLAYVSFLQMHARPSVPYAHRVATSSSARTFSTSRLLSSPYSTVGPSRAARRRGSPIAAPSVPPSADGRRHPSRRRAHRRRPRLAAVERVPHLDLLVKRKHARVRLEPYPEGPVPPPRG